MVVGHERPITALFEWLFQQVRYGERTARGITGGMIVCWAFTSGEMIRMSSIRISIVSGDSDAMKEIELLRPLVTPAPDKQTTRIDEGVACRRAENDSNGIRTDENSCGLPR